jgi:hypothetical protein
MEGLSAVAWHRPALGHRNRVALFPPRRPLARYPSTTMLQKFGQGVFNRELSRHPTVPGLSGAGKDLVAASRHSLSSPFF